MSDVNTGMGDRRGRSRPTDNSGRQGSAEITGAGGLSWRIFATAFALNLAWEMIQMFGYAGMNQVSTASFLTCLGAALADALYITCVYWIGRAIQHSPVWIFKLSVLSTFAILLSGFCTAVAIERLALFEGFWQYREAMPKLPFGVGIWPVLQLMVTPIAAFWLVRHWPHWKRRSRQTGIIL